MDGWAQVMLLYFTDREPIFVSFVWYAFHHLAYGRDPNAASVPSIGHEMNTTVGIRTENIFSVGIKIGARSFRVFEVASCDFVEGMRPNDFEVPNDEATTSHVGWTGETCLPVRAKSYQSERTKIQICENVANDVV